MIIEDGTDLALRTARLLESKKQELGLSDLRIVTQEEFLKAAAAQPVLSESERLTVVNQTELVLRGLYAHLAFKNTQDPDQDPFVALAGLRKMISTVSDFDFHTFMLLALARVRDIHTTYLAPSPYRGAVAFLPFQVRFFDAAAQSEGRCFLVTRTMAASQDGGAHPHFRVGAEIVAWNGLDPVEAATAAAQLQPGANAGAELSRGVGRMTVRPIASHGITADTAAIRYRAPGEETEREITFPWLVAAGISGGSFTSKAFSASESLMAMQRWSKYSYRPDKVIAASSSGGKAGSFETQFATDPAKAGFPHPELLANPEDPDWPMGYLRIRDFSSSATFEEQDLQELSGILRRMDREAPGGLVVDIRGNPGGHIPLAERMLQLFTPRAIHPLLFHFPRTELINQALTFFRANRSGANEFAAWLDSEPGDEIEDQHLTPGRTLTPIKEANDTGQVYQGPVVLLIDALTYSAADMFAAGFQDHDIGTIVGVDYSTGGGGANSWSYDEILSNLSELPEELRSQLPTKLPLDCGLSVAVRRCTRTGPGLKVIEDVGVLPDLLYSRTRRDVLEGNADLFAFACGTASRACLHRIDVTQILQTTAGAEITVVPMCVDYVVFRAGEEKLAHGSVLSGEPATFSITLPAGDGPVSVRVEGFECEADSVEGLPVAAPRITLRGSEVAAEKQKAGRDFLRKTPVSRTAGRAKAAGAA